MSTFTSSEIKNSKALLLESLPTDQSKLIRRKGKEDRDLDEIVSVFKSTDVVPVFVATELEKLLPIFFHHLDLTKLKSEIENIKGTYATVEQL